MSASATLTKEDAQFRDNSPTYCMQCTTGTSPASVTIVQRLSDVLICVRLTYVGKGEPFAFEGDDLFRMVVAVIVVFCVIKKCCCETCVVLSKLLMCLSVFDFCISVLFGQAALCRWQCRVFHEL